MSNAKITGTITREITVRGDVKHTYISSGGGGGGGGAASVANACVSSFTPETYVIGNAVSEQI